jgi:hypothetical protein
MYASGITFTGVTPSAAAGTLSGANNGLEISTIDATKIVLGQDVGEAGSPAALISNREIPLAGFDLNVLTQANSNVTFSPGGTAVIFDPTNTGVQPMEYLTIQGKNPGSGTFGNFQLFWVDQTFTNPDGQIDASLIYGYNYNAGTQVNPNEAAFGFTIESHFDQGAVKQFEWYMTSITYAGVESRNQFMIVNKTTGAANFNWQVDNFNISTTNNNGNRLYLTTGPSGAINMTGDAPGISFTPLVPANDGAMEIICLTGAGAFGTTEFIDTSGNANSSFRFEAACKFDTAKFVQGFSNFWFSSTAALGGTRNFGVFNGNFDNGRMIFTVWNDGTVGCLGRTQFGAEYGATALVSISAGTAAAGTAPLKFTQGPVMTTPEAGAMEYDGTDLFFTKVATREAVIIGNNLAAAPALNAGAVFTSRYGGNTNALGDPVSWLETTINAVLYKIPLYQ